MTYGYIRVSSDKQTVENQRFEIKNFCSGNQISVNGWIEETISGTKNYTKRQLGSLLEKVKQGDLIVCTEHNRSIQLRQLFFFDESGNSGTVNFAYRSYFADGYFMLQ